MLESTPFHFIYRQCFCFPQPVTVSLVGQTGIVTGANSGLGFEACKQLLSLGISRLILAVRNEKLGEEAREKLLENTGRTDADAIEVWKLDMASYKSIVEFAKRTESLERLDFVMLNAGVLKAGFTRAPETGHEMTLQVNVFGTALLAILMLPVLEKAQGNSTITVVTSDTQEWGDANKRYGQEPEIIKALDSEAKFDDGQAYFNSKLLEVLFVRELVKHVPDTVTVNLANPGLCRGSQLSRETLGLRRFGMLASQWLLGRRQEVGARDLVRAAVAVGKESHGKYISEGGIARSTHLADQGKAADLGKRLWNEMVEEFSRIAPIKEILRDI